MAYTTMPAIPTVHTAIPTPVVVYPKPDLSNYRLSYYPRIDLGYRYTSPRLVVVPPFPLI